MITLIEAKKYRCLYYVRQHLEPFHVLVGPNASGKTTFLDVVAFLGDLVSLGPLDAISKRTNNFHDLLWGRAGEGFELAIEAAIPEDLRSRLRDPNCVTVRYEIALQFDEKNQEITIQAEKVLLKTPPIKPQVVPSWMVSDGTLRLMALTILAYLPDFTGTYLIEEPENGIHPKGVDTLFQSLSSVYDAQILVATHSPVILGLADIKNVLCFAKTDEGMVDIVRGDKHPQLKNWKGEANLGVLFAGGVLG